MECQQFFRLYINIQIKIPEIGVSDFTIEYGFVADGVVNSHVVDTDQVFIEADIMAERVCNIQIIN